MLEQPFTISGRAAARLGELERTLGNWEGALGAPAPPPALQRQNGLSALFATLALSGRSTWLPGDATLEGAREHSLGRDQLELENARHAYERVGAWEPFNRAHLLEAHGLLMHGLSPEAGRFRNKGAQGAVQSLLKQLRPGRELPPIVAAVLCYRELTALRPFVDGNGRLARLWLRVMLRRAASVFEHAPIEEVLLQHRSRFETALAGALQRAAGDAFLETWLELLLLSLRQLGPQLRGRAETPDARLAKARVGLGKRWFSRKDYLAFFPKLSTASASRDLAAAVTSKAAEARGERRFTEYRFR